MLLVNKLKLMHKYTGRRKRCLGQKSFHSKKIAPVAVVGNTVDGYGFPSLESLFLAC